MDLVIENATVITGDGKSVLPEASVWVEGDRIAGIEQGNGKAPAETSARRIDGTGQYLIPGVINHHAHGVTGGPFSTGAAPFSDEKLLRFADRHLLQGTTTVVNVCGFGTYDEHEAIAKRHPMNIKLATGHVPSNIKAAELVDGIGMTEKHKEARAEDLLDRGAVALGEIGAGGTLGGGAQDYKYIPKILKEETGIEIHPLQARSLKIAVLGKYMRRDAFDKTRVTEVLEEIGLKGKLSVERAREIVEEITLPPVEYALLGFDEAVDISSRTGVPAVFHSTAVSAQRLLDLARASEDSQARLVAGHSNHNMFEVDEAVEMAQQMRDVGVVIDVSSLDCIITHWRNSTERLDALAREGLIDTISTDFAGGHWDSVLETAHWLVDRDYSSVPEAVAMATGNVAKVFDRAAPDRGLIEKGKVADLVLTDDKNLGRVETVIVGGQVVADGGWLRYDNGKGAN